MMNRIFLLFFVLGPLTIPFAGCVSQAQMNMQRALFAQEYRQLEDELFLTYQNMDRLEQKNAQLRSQLGEEDGMEPTVRTNRRERRGNVAPDVAPISTEGIKPSTTIPSVLQNSQSSRSHVKPLPQPIEQAQYVELEPEFAGRPSRPIGGTSAELPAWRPNR